MLTKIFHKDDLIMSDDAFKIRKMRHSEVEAVAEILLYYASRAVLLWRTPEDILAHSNNFFVAEGNDRIIGCVAIQDYGNGLYELRSLAVHHNLMTRGIGTELVKAIINECQARDGNSLFALTKQKDFFTRLNFELTEREFFPQKVWNDCMLCHKKDACDEEAVVYKLK